MDLVFKRDGEAHISIIQMGSKPCEGCIHCTTISMVARIQVDQIPSAPPPGQTPPPKGSQGARTSVLMWRRSEKG